MIIFIAARNLWKGHVTVIVLSYHSVPYSQGSTMIAQNLSMQWVCQSTFSRRSHACTLSGIVRLVCLPINTMHWSRRIIRVSDTETVAHAIALLCLLRDDRRALHVVHRQGLHGVGRDTLHGGSGFHEPQCLQARHTLALNLKNHTTLMIRRHLERSEHTTVA